MADYVDEERKDMEESSGIDFRMVWFIISVVVCLGLAYAYLRYQHPVYQSSAKILIKDDNNNRKNSGQGMSIDQLGIITNTNGFENELEIISSTAVATRAVKALKLYVTYTIEGRVTEAELYKNSPVLVDLEESRLEMLKTRSAFPSAFPRRATNPMSFRVS